MLLKNPKKLKIIPSIVIPEAAGYRESRIGPQEGWFIDMIIKIKFVPLTPGFPPTRE